MLVIVTISSLAISYIIYSTIFKNDPNKLEKKLDFYDRRKEDIENEIEDHKNSITILEDEKKDVERKISNLLIKKIENYAKEDDQNVKNLFKKIKKEVNFYCEGDENMRDNVYNNINKNLKKELDDCSSDETDVDINDLDSIDSDVPLSGPLEDEFDPEDDIPDEYLNYPDYESDDLFDCNFSPKFKKCRFSYEVKGNNDVQNENSDKEEQEIIKEINLTSEDGDSELEYYDDIN